jgi:hypothetical protein
MGVAVSYFILDDNENPKPTTYSERVEKKNKMSLKQNKEEGPKRSRKKLTKKKVSKNKKK